MSSRRLSVAVLVSIILHVLVFITLVSAAQQVVSTEPSDSAPLDVQLVGVTSTRGSSSIAHRLGLSERPRPRPAGRPATVTAERTDNVQSVGNEANLDGVSGAKGENAPESVEEKNRFGAGNGNEIYDGRNSGPDLTRLHRQLAVSAQRCYPPAAKRFRLEGVAKLRFCLNASGELVSVVLTGSTGSALLDRAATECVVPGASPINVGEGCYSVPIKFGLLP